MYTAQQCLGPAARCARRPRLTGASLKAPAYAVPITGRAIMPSDEELQEWMRAVAGAADRQAFAALFRHFAPRVKGYLIHSGTPASQAEELTQETMVALWRKAGRYDPVRAGLSTWIYTIARNLRIDARRRESASAAPGSDRLGAWHADQLPADARADPDSVLWLTQRARGVARALRELPAEQARVLRLSFFEAQPHGQIARELGVPLGTVKSRIRLAVAQLRQLLDGLQS